EIRPESSVFRLETDASGRVRRALYRDAEGREHEQRGRAFVVSANGAETARLLLRSTSSLFPQRLANSSGMVGKHLMFNGQTYAYGVFQHPLNEYKSVQVTRILHDFYESDPSRGFYGGGGIDARMSLGPIQFALWGLPQDAPTWGAEYKRLLRDYTHTVEINGHTTSLPVETNSVTLDPEVKDKWGEPALRVTYSDHADDLATMHFMQDRSVELLEAAGAQRIWRTPITTTTIAAHLLGTCRMGDDPARS